MNPQARPLAGRLRVPGGVCGIVLLLAAAALSCQGKGLSPGRIEVRVAADRAGSVCAGTRFVLVREDVNVTYSRIQVESPDLDQDRLLELWGAAVEGSALDRKELDKGGKAAFSRVAPGRYWVANPAPVRLGELRVVWAEPVTLADSLPGGSLVLELSNAALLLDEKDSPAQ
jgi:hypothetical protein